MQKQYSTVEKICLAVMVCTGWFALGAQFYITAGTRATSVPEMLIRFISYFTIQTNLLVAVCYTTLLMAPGTAWGRFFAKQQSLAAITVYIIIVGLIYNTILRVLWSPVGLQRTVNELLHSVVPVLCVVYWLVFAGKDQLQWKNVFPWLIYPFIYIIYILVRGSLSGFYPYPFISTDHLGLNKVLVNSAGIAVVFIIMSLVLVGIGKSLSRPSAG